MNGDLAELLNATETGGVTNVEGILIHKEFVDANADKCMKASKEMCSVFARYTNSESSTIVRSVTGLDGVKDWTSLHANHSRRTLGRIFRVRRERMYQSQQKTCRQVRLAIRQLEEKWKAMKKKIPDLWRTSVFLETCAKDVKEQMMMRLDEIGEHNENLNAKVCHTRRARPSKRGNICMCRWRWTA